MNAPAPHGHAGPASDRHMRIGICCYPTAGGSGVVATELGKHLADASKKYDEIGRGFSTLSAKLGEIQSDDHKEGTP